MDIQQILNFFTRKKHFAINYFLVNVSSVKAEGMREGERMTERVGITKKKIKIENKIDRYADVEK